MKKALTFTLACGALALAALQARAEDGITIGMAVAMSGWMEAYDGEAYKMAQLWVDRQNAKGGLLGKPIKVTSGDTKTDRVEGAKVGQDLVKQGANLLLVSALRSPCRRRRRASFRCAWAPQTPRPASSASGRFPSPPTTRASSKAP